ncbi:MAG: hypothetical protein H7X95_07585 [Deltaproteobacteria bacterium]|nr:hypothetical protein [Deltaproteobacteria bacterium]
MAPAASIEATPLALQVRAARASGDSRRALVLYRALAQKGGAAGENAENEIGRVLRDGLHQPREAVAAWRLYRAQHPRGLLRIEADISLIETLVLMGDKTAAVAEASDFIQRHPDSERRAEIARLAGDLLRERGACADAIAAYETALRSGHGRKDVADGASFHRAVCTMRGARSEGMAALQAYLVSFPNGRFRAEAQGLLNGTDSAQANKSLRQVAK